MTDANTICHDLDLLDDWLAGKGYGEEAGLVLRALSLIHKQAREIETLNEIAVRETMKVATLRAALKLFQPYSIPKNATDTDDLPVLIGDIRAAAAALKETGDE